MKDFKEAAETWARKSIHAWTPLHVESLASLLAETYREGKGDKINKDLDGCVNLPDLEMVSIEGGSFMMGDDEGEFADEKPAHPVHVSGFYMGKFQVTQKLWQAVMGSNPSQFKSERHPVENVSWHDVQDFLKELNKKSGKDYRLPTEAEWEYAARAKSSYRYSGGDDLDVVAWHGGNSGGSTHSVGQKKANAFGLYDMSGNVLEWCGDWFDAESYKAYSRYGEASNPIGPDSGTHRVLRGGGSFGHPLSCRSVFRNRPLPEGRGGSIGFRLVLPFRAAGS